MELQLVSSPRPASFIIPAIAFRSEAHAVSYCRRLPNGFLRHPIVLLHGSGGRCYVQRPEKRFRYLRNGDFLRRPPGFFSTPIRLSWGKAKPTSSGSYSVFLLREGAGTFVRATPDILNTLPCWCKAFAKADKDCYGVWEHAEEGKSLPVMQYRDFRHEGVRIRVARKAVGALYAREAMYGKSGNVTGTQTTVVLVRASVSQAFPPQLALRVERAQCFARPDEEPAEPELTRIPERYHGLVERAREGFLRECHTISPKVAEPYQFIREQLDKDLEDERNGNGFAHIAEDLSVDEALALAQEPWQFAVVADLHADRRYDNGRPHTQRNRILSMIRRSSAADERKKLFTSWLENYLACVDDELDQEIADTEEGAL